MRQPTGDGERLALLPVGRQPGDIGPRHVGILGIYADALAPHATRILQIVAAYIGVCGDHPRLAPRGALAGGELRRTKRLRRPALTQENVGAPGQGEAMGGVARQRSEEHTSELQSLLRTSYAVFCL